ncbi:hypothetical protein HPB50_009755 [Hyalomma asiaticum]|uniref:Uncharacterized protein n=1 Tax=Hyalomma asiaticum TaxID=266040 RepID=A0ACB7S1F3_HYAAI|nr:hypothetical protein HPB50_009755 [Hyalomma asiaticum]
MHFFLLFSPPLAARVDVRPGARASSEADEKLSGRKRKPLVSPDRLRRGPLIAADAELTTSPGWPPSPDRTAARGGEETFGGSGAAAWHTTNHTACAQ